MKKSIKLILIFTAMLLAIMFFTKNESQAETYYIGDINSEVMNISIQQNSAGNYYISGEIVVVEWVNGESTVPKQTPRIVFRNNYGDWMDAFVTPTGTNTYYFDKFIDGANGTKWYFDVELTETNNLSVNKAMVMPLRKFEDKILGDYKNNTVLVIGDSLAVAEKSIKLNSELKKIELHRNPQGKYYISGEIVIVKWVNGVPTVPKNTPKMSMKGYGLPGDLFVTPTGTNTYYFDKYIEGLGTFNNAQYWIEISLDNENSYATTRMWFGKYDNTILGTYKDVNIRLHDNGFITFNKGTINTELKKLSLVDTNYEWQKFISGEIVVVKWIGNISTVPNRKPKMWLKSTDGKVTLDVFITPTGTNTYYFDRNIAGIDESKEYYFEIQLDDADSYGAYSDGTSMNVIFGNQYQDKILGFYLDRYQFPGGNSNYNKDFAVKIYDNKIKFIEVKG